MLTQDQREDLNDIPDFERIRAEFSKVGIG